MEIKMFAWYKRKKEWKMRFLKEDLMITIPSVNQLMDSFSYHLSQDIGKRDIENYNKELNDKARLQSIIENLKASCEFAFKAAIAEKAAWPKRMPFWKRPL